MAAESRSHRRQESEEKLNNEVIVTVGQGTPRIKGRKLNSTSTRKVGAPKRTPDRVKSEKLVVGLRPGEIELIDSLVHAGIRGEWARRILLAEARKMAKRGEKINSLPFIYE